MITTDASRLAPPASRLALSSLLLPLCALGWLWFTLVNHLRVEWSANPQYAYGWAVPFLCLYLLWRRVAQASQPASFGGIPAAAETFSAVGTGALQGSPTIQGSRFKVQGSTFNVLPVHLPSSILYLLLASVALLYLPTRLIQEANPEWRLVSWALALEVIGITLLLLKTAEDGRRKTEDGPRTTSPASRITIHVSRFTFPICFFLVAVPWPTFIEAPLIQGLMRANIGATIELLGAIGVPALQHGNVIEIATGRVGIDEACSGIRSFQAALMLSLFFGEVYRLCAVRRALCVAAGFALAFVFNVGRTLLLTWVASAKGVGAVASWHDPAGITILVACFVSLWLIAGAGRAETLKSLAVTTQYNLRWTQINPDNDCSKPGLSTAGIRSLESGFLIGWLFLVEGSTQLWYRSHEWGLPKTATWQVEFPRANPTFRDLPFSDKTKQFLRYDEGCNGTWQQGSEQRWQAIFLRWNPGRIAVHLAKSHTPEVCLTASGRELVSQSDLRAVPVHGMQLPFRSYVVKDQGGPLHVFYCLWEDRASAQSFRTTRMNYANRLAPVLAGRRNSGQRSLEVAVWGIADQNEAEAALARELGKLIRIEK